MNIIYYHKYGFTGGILSCQIVDSITVSINNNIVKDENGNPKQFESIAAFYKFLLEKKGIEIHEQHRRG
jgi:hypothetical protein